MARKEEGSGTVLGEDDTRTVEVPGDGSCLFWAIALPYLIQVRNNSELFKERFEKLFGAEERSQLPHVRRLITKFHSSINNGHAVVLCDVLLRTLVTEVFRQRTVEKMAQLEEELMDSVTIEDLKESFITDGTFREFFKETFGSELDELKVNLDKLRPKVLNEATLSEIEGELEKIGRNRLVDLQRFKFRMYLESMKSSGSWGGSHEIRVIEHMLGCEIIVISGNQSVSTQKNHSGCSENKFVGCENQFFNAESHAIDSQNKLFCSKNQSICLENQLVCPKIQSICSKNQLVSSENQLISNDKNSIIYLLNNQRVHYQFLLFEAQFLIQFIDSLTDEECLVYLRIGLDEINYRDSNGSTLLHFAAKNNHLKSIQLLINQGANTTIKNHLGQTALDLAVALNSHHSIPTLNSDTKLDLSDLVSAPNDNLDLLSKRTHQSLLEYEIDINEAQNLTKNIASVPELSGTIMHEAAEEGNETNLALILSSLGQNAKFPLFTLNALTIIGDGQQTALHSAARNNSVKAVEKLIENAADVNAKDADGETPLHYAVQNGQLNMIKLLVEKGKAEINGLNYAKKSSLHMAVAFGHLSVVKYLVKSGADVNSKDRTSVSVLSEAVKAGCLMTVHFLVEKGADIKSVDENRLTLLRHAANGGKWEIVKYLVERGAELKAEGGALKEVLEGGQLGLAGLMITNGAPTEDLSEEQMSEFLKMNCISLIGEEEDVISGLMVLGNAQLLEKYINNLVGKDKLQIEEVLPKVYEEIQLLNVPLPSSMSLFVESHIFKSRLFSNKKIIVNENAEKINYDETKVENNVDDIVKRINIVIDCVEDLEQTGFELSDRFSFLGKFIVRNMEILKNQLRFCCTKLPWTEMQFCLIDCVSRFCDSRPKNVDFISSLILNRSRLMAHLAHFKTNLQILKSELKFDRKIKFDKRKDSIAFVLKLNPGFRSLYEDYEIVRDVYSLNRIESHLNAAAALDLNKEDALVSEQVMLRALQVTGECLKNTEDSPNMSDNVHRSLMAMAPTNIKDIVTSLRDSLSHVDHLHKVKNMEDRWNLLKDHPEIQNFLPETKNFLPETKNFLPETKNILPETNNFLSETNNFLPETKNFFSETKKFLPETKNFLPETKNILPETNNFLPETNNFLPETNNFLPETKNFLPETKNFLPETKNCFADVEKDLKWLCGIQKDVMKLKYEITFQLFLKSDFAVTTFSRRIFECESIENAKEIIEGIRSEDMELELNDNRLEIVRKILELCEMFKQVVKTPTDYQRNLLKHLELEMGSIEWRWQIESRKHANNVKMVKSLLFFIQDGGEMESIRRKAGSKVGEAKPEMKTKFHFLSGLKSDITYIYNSLEESERFRHDELFCQICNLIEFEAKRTKSIEKLNLEMDKQLIFDDENEMMEKSEENVKEILREVSREIIFDNDSDIGNEILGQIDNKKELYRSKNQLMDYYSKIIDIYEDIYDNCVDVYNAFISSFKVLCDLNNPEISDFYKNQSLIIMKLIEENQLLSELNLINTINEKEFKILLEKMKSKEMNSLEEIFLNKNFHFDKLLLIDVEIFIYSGKKIKINFKNVFDIFLKNSNKKVNLIEKKGKNRKKDEAQVAKLINKKELELLIGLIKLDLSIDEESFNLPAMTKALNLSSETFILNDFSLSNSKSLKQNLQKSDSYGKLVKEASKEPDMTKLSLPFKKFLQPLNSKLKPEIDLAVEKVFRKMEKNRKLRFKDYFFHKIDILSKIFPIEKSDLELLNLLKSDVNIRLSVEILVLNLTETLENLSLFDSNNKLYLDEVSPVLVGKSLRNYLAHGDALINILSTNYHMSLINHFRLFQRRFSSKDEFYSGQFLIGKTAQENPHKITEHYNHIRSILIKKSQLTNITKDNEIENLKELIDNPKYLKLRNAFGETLLHFYAFANDLSLFRHLSELGLSMFIKNKSGHSPIHFLITAGREKIIRYLLEIGFDSSFIVENGETLLHLAVQFGHLNVVRLLLAYNADTEAVNNEGHAPVTKAVAYGHRSILEVLLRAGSDAGWKGKNGETLTHLANAEILKVLLEKNVDLSALDNDLNAPLHLACFKGKEDVVEMLLHYPVNVIDKNKSGLSPIHLAAGEGHLKIVQSLLENNIQLVDIKTTDNKTPLYLACYLGDLEMVQLLLANGADVNAKCVDDMTALHAATRMGHLRVMDALLDNDQLIIDSFSGDKTPLHFATEIGAMEAFKKLVARGANVSLPTKDTGLTALHLASFVEDLELIKFILNIDKELMESVDSAGRTAFHDCALLGKINPLNFLIENGANLEAKDDEGSTPLLISAFMGHAHTFRALFNNGASMEAREKDNCSAVHFAAQNNNIAIMKQLIERKVDLNQRARNGHSALHLASENGHLEMVRLLLENGMEIDVRGLGDWTALHSAASHDHERVVRYLVKKKAGVNALTVHEFTPLHYACMNGYASSVALLLENGADVNLKTDKKWTVLHYAAERGRSEIVEILLDKVKADLLNQLAPVNSNKKRDIPDLASEQNDSIIDRADFIDAVTEAGATALNISAHHGHFDTVKALLKHGASVNLGDGDNNTALHWAIGRGHSSCARLLIENGADLDAINRRSCTPLHVAAETRLPEFVDILIGRGARVADNILIPLLHLAVEESDVLMANVLNNEGADINAIKGQETVALNVACAQGNFITAESLVQSTPEIINRKARCGFTPLHMAAFYGHSNIVEFLLKNGAQVDERMECGCTALHWAAKRGHNHAVGLLLSFKADANASNETLSTPLHMAVSANRIEVAEMLIRVGRADVLARNRHDTVLHKAVLHEEMLQMILKAIEKRTEAEVVLRKEALNAKDNEGDSPLMWAAHKGRVGATKMLLMASGEEALLDVDMRNESGNTALHWAALNGHLEVVEVLVFEGKANVMVRNSEGESAFDLAAKRRFNDEKYESIAAFLFSFAS